MKTIAYGILVAALACSFGCARPDWIEQTPGIVVANAVPVLRPDQVPPPATLARAEVRSVYSPALLTLHGRLHLFYGVAPLCQGGQVFADSIALAVSDDGGKTFHHDRYLITSPPEACSLPLAQWPRGFLWQFNDPFVWKGTDGAVWMVYTAAEWPQECGNIGVIAFDPTTWAIRSRNDRYVDSYQCQRSAARPSIAWAADGAHRLWFDTVQAGSLSALNVSVPFPDTESAPRTELPLGGGPFVANLDVAEASANGDVTVLGDGVDGIVTLHRAQGRWGQGRQVTTRSGQPWDSWFHGTATAFEGRVYFAGFQSVQGVPIGTLAAWR